MKKFNYKLEIEIFITGWTGSGEVPVYYSETYEKYFSHLQGLTLRFLARGRKRSFDKK